MSRLYKVCYLLPGLEEWEWVKGREIRARMSAGQGTLQGQEAEVEAALCARVKQRLHSTWQLQRRDTVRPYRPSGGLTDPLYRIPRALRLRFQVFLGSILRSPCCASERAESCCSGRPFVLDLCMLRTFWWLCPPSAKWTGRAWNCPSMSLICGKL